MQYDADFASADPANAPLDAPLFIGADPFLWGVLLLAVIGALALGWWLGQGGSRRADGEAVERIWEDIHDAIKATMKASSHALPGQAARLREVIEARLGQTLKLAGGLAGPLDAMTCALEGRRNAPDHAAHPAPHREDARGEPATAAPAASASAVVTIISPGADPGAGAGHGGHDGEGGTHAPRPLSPRERNAALRSALDDLHDHWSVRRARVAEMRAAWNELSGAGLPRDRGPRLSHDH